MLIRTHICNPAITVILKETVVFLVYTQEKKQVSTTYPSKESAHKAFMCVAAKKKGRKPDMVHHQEIIFHQVFVGPLTPSLI